MLLSRGELGSRRPEGEVRVVCHSGVVNMREAVLEDLLLRIFPVRVEQVYWRARRGTVCFTPYLHRRRLLKPPVSTHHD